MGVGARVGGALLALLALLACAGPARDAGRLAVGRVVAACGRWAVDTPPDGRGRVLLDVYFGGPASGAERRPGPTPADVAAVTAVGGRVVHRFAIRAVRADLPADSVPALRRVANHARAVPDPRRHDWEVIVAYRRPPTQRDEALFRRLGGRVRSRLGLIDALAGALPDAGIAALWGRPEVRYIEGNGVGCVDR